MPFFIRTKCVTIHGTEYRQEAVVCLGAEPDYELPFFGSISKIIVLPSGHIFFYIKKFVTLEIDNHFHAYKVRRELNPGFTFIEQDQLATYLPAHSMKPYGSNMSCGSMYIAPRYTVCNL